MSRLYSGRLNDLIKLFFQIFFFVYNACVNNYKVKL